MKLEEEELTLLIKKCKNGDNNAFNQIFTTYGKILYGIALRYSKDTSEADDILQEAFIKIFEKVINYNFTGSFEGWLKRIVVNTALNKVQKNKTLKEDDLDIIQFHHYNETITSNINAEELLLMIRKLPPGYNAVFNLYAIEGYSHKEIAEMLQITEGTSKSQLSKAKQWLRTILEHQEIEENEKS